MNGYESGALAGRLAEAGHEVTTEIGQADLYIINTCAVTREAERKSKNIVSRAARTGAKVIVCGCSSENDAQKYADKANLIIGTAGKQLLSEMLGEEGIAVFPQPKIFEEAGVNRGERVRSYVKVQDGCNNFCSYCLIPYLRGRSRSRSEAEILREVSELSGRVKEFVITGIDLSSYGAERGDGLWSLMKKLNSRDFRVRLGSLEAGIIDERLLGALADMENFCEHFHLSLQSGSDEVLRRMNRKYTGGEYLEKVALIRSYFPRASVTTDMIAGFPTETEAQHRDSVRLAEEAAFSDIHVFCYSRRTGTAAAKLPSVGKNAAAAREAELLELKKRLKASYIARNAGSTLELLTEEENGGYLVGYTGNYIRAYLPAGAAQVNERVTVTAAEPFRDGLTVKIPSRNES